MFFHEWSICTSSGPLLPELARACKGPQEVQMDHEWKNISREDNDFTRETFYKLRMGLCSMRTGITNFLSVFSCWKNDFTPLFSNSVREKSFFFHKWRKNHFSFTSERKKWRKIIFLHKWKKNDFSLTPLLNKGVKSFFQPMKKHWKKIK